MLWWLSHGTETLNSVAERFGVAASTCHRIRRRLCSLVSNHLVHKLVTWPRSVRAVQKLRDGFDSNSSDGRMMSGIIGAIDGTHIPIRPPNHYPEVWINRKGFHSMQLQVVVDANMNIIDAFTGYPGSVHDAKVFKRSPLGTELMSACMNGETSDLCPDDCYIIGDAAYPLMTSLITPFRNIGINEKHKETFNTIHSSRRMVVERAIGLLKGRSRRLMHCMDVVDEEDVTEAVMTCVAIHQLALRCDDSTDIQELMDEVSTNGNAAEAPPTRPVGITGEDKRQQIMVDLGLL